MWRSYYVPASVPVILRAACPVDTLYSCFTSMETEAQGKHRDRGPRTRSDTRVNACGLSPDPVLSPIIPRDPVKMYSV